MTHSLPTLADVRAAHARIASGIRRTPHLAIGPAKRTLSSIGRVDFKLEYLQVSGSFKARGALNKALSLPPEALANGLVTASGGNHGLGVAFAAWRAGIPARIVVPTTTPTHKVEKLRTWGATVSVEGGVWDEANRIAQDFASQHGAAYIHPFADPLVIAGQGTLALEILEDAPDTTVLIAAIGGGGLISGVALAARAINPAIRILGVEPVGASAVHDSLRAGHPVTLERVTTRVGTLAARSTEPINFELIRANVAEVALLTDDEMQAAAEWLYFEYGIAAELSGAAAAAGLLTGKLKLRPDDRACVLVCGAGPEGVIGR